MIFGIICNQLPFITTHNTNKKTLQIKTRQTKYIHSLEVKFQLKQYTETMQKFQTSTNSKIMNQLQMNTNLELLCQERPRREWKVGRDNDHRQCKANQEKLFC